MKEIKSAIAVSKVDEQYVMGHMFQSRDKMRCWCNC